MNFFSSDALLQIVGDVYYPGCKLSIELVGVGEHTYRLLVADGKVVKRAPFLDFFEPTEGTPKRRTKFLPRVSTSIIRASEWHEGISPSPTTLWSEFADWDAFVVSAKKTSGFASNLARKSRKLVREVGELRFVYQESDLEILKTCLAWKSRQYVETGHIDLFASEKITRFFTELFARGHLVLSVLYAGTRPAAISASVDHEKRFYYWLSGYDPELPGYSSGTILLESLLAESFRRGHKEFDFLMGSESYKWNYATHARVVTIAGRPPRAQQIYEAARGPVMKWVREQQWLYTKLQNLKRDFVQRRVGK